MSEAITIHQCLRTVIKQAMQIQVRALGQRPGATASDAPSQLQCSGADRACSKGHLGQRGRSVHMRDVTNIFTNKGWNMIRG